MIFLCLLSIICLLSMVFFLINSKLQRSFLFLKVMTLPCLSRVLEKLFYLRLSEFLTKFNILKSSPVQFQTSSLYCHGYLRACQICEGFENNQYTVRVFIDLKKAFDTVNHEILLDKLSFYGIGGIPLAWLASYLSHAQITVCHGS